MGVDRQAIIDHLLQGQAIIAIGPILPGTWAYYDGQQSVSYDPDAARALLVTAGYSLPKDGTVRANKDGVEMHFTLAYPDDDLHKALAQKIQSYWQALNVTVDLEALPYDQLISDRLSAHNYQAALVDFEFVNSPNHLIHSGMKSRSPAVKTTRSGIIVWQVNIWKKRVQPLT